MKDQGSTRLEWTPSANLPKARTSFAGVGYGEMLERARALVPKIAARAEQCERLRRLPDETERDLHEAGLFRIAQPARVGGADLDVGIFVDVCAEIARVCPSTAWNIGNLASHHWMLGYFPPETQDALWDVSTDVLIATSLAFPAGRGRKVEGGYEVSGRWPLSSGVDNSDWNMLGFMLREHEDGPPVDHRFALLHRSQYEIIDNWHAVGLCGTGSKDVATKAMFVPEQSLDLGLDVQRQAACRLGREPLAAVPPAAVLARPLCADGRHAGLRPGRLRARWSARPAGATPRPPASRSTPIPPCRSRWRRRVRASTTPR